MNFAQQGDVQEILHMNIQSWPEAAVIIAGMVLAGFIIWCLFGRR